MKHISSATVLLLILGAIAAPTTKASGDCSQARAALEHTQGPLTKQAESIRDRGLPDGMVDLGPLPDFSEVPKGHKLWTFQHSLGTARGTVRYAFTSDSAADFWRTFVKNRGSLEAEFTEVCG